MKHEPEHQEAPSTDAARLARELAACYARVFLGSADGQRVLADLRTKFGLDRLVFVRNDRGQVDMNGGLLRDGERRVLHEIETALRLGAPNHTLVRPHE